MYLFFFCIEKSKRSSNNNNQGTVNGNDAAWVEQLSNDYHNSLSKFEEILSNAQRYDDPSQFIAKLQGAVNSSKNSLASIVTDEKFLEVFIFILFILFLK